jgi:hypothetical protein
MNSVLIAMPCYGGMVSDKTVKGLFNLGKDLRTKSIDHGFLTIANESLITKGRSRLTNFFMNNTEYEKILFIDADVGFTSDDALKLILSDKEIICGAYPMKSIPLRYNYNISSPPVAEDSLVQIENIGFGFCCIRRKVFQSIQNHYGEELRYCPTLNNSNYPVTEKEYNNSYHYFLEMKKDMHFLPEDFSFFERASSVGYKSWLDTTIHLSHVGSHVFQEE